MKERDMSFNAARTAGNPKGFNAAVLAVIDGLGGDRSTGMCLCPVHDDRNPSLSVNNGDRVPVVLHCFGCGRDAEIVDYLKRNNLWPDSAAFTGTRATAAADEGRSAEERWRYARDMWNALIDGYGDKMAPMLHLYTDKRGLSRVPPEAVMTMPLSWAGGRADNLPSENAGMVLPVIDRHGKFRAICVTWLNPTLDGKRAKEGGPRRQTYGLLRSNFVEIDYLGDLKQPLDKLFVGEGVETTEAATQMAALLLDQRPKGIASAGSANMAVLDPPDAREYVLLVDSDRSGESRKKAGMLAQRLVGAVVRIAVAPAPENAKPGYDWNDALLDARGDEEKLQELARALVEAPRFESTMTAEERREVRINALVRLKLDDQVSYDQQRKEAAKDFDIRVMTLDDEVEKRLKILRDEQVRERSKPVPVNMELLEASARDIIASENVLELFAKDASRMVAGEKVNLKMLLLCGTSRLFEDKAAMNVAFKGTSGGGKSNARDEVLKFFPPEDVVAFTSISPAALLYHEEDFPHKILSMGEAMDREQIAFQDQLLRQLMSEGKLRHLVVQKVGDKMVTVPVEKNGPVVFFLTTTKNMLHPENETRLISLEIDDSQSQTARVLKKVAAVIGLNQDAPGGDFYKRWQDHQRYLKAGEVRVQIPYADPLAELVGGTKLAHAPRFRRDFGQLLRAIKAHALLHRPHRRINDHGEIIADISHDYVTVRTLMKDLLATAAELKVRQQILETVEAVKQVCRDNFSNRDRCSDDMPRNDQVENGDAATVRQVADVLKLDRSAAYRRVRAAEHLELIVNVEKRERQPGRSGRYRVTGQRLIAVTNMLPGPNTLREAYEDYQEQQDRSSQQTPRNTVHRRTGGG
jgi:hypothetical protein